MADYYPAISKDFLLSLRVVAGFTCFLSILGAFFIIFTYVMFKGLRTLSRQILVNLSVADIFIAASHLVGLCTDVERFFPQYACKNQTNNCTVLSTDSLCTIQAAFTMYGSISSFLWTMSLGLYMFLVIIMRKPDFGKYFVIVSYLVCWGLPLGLVIWFGAVHPTYLGFAESADVVWCYIRVVNVNGTEDYQATLIAQLIGYDIWVYATFFILPAIYFTLMCYLRYRERSYHAQANRTTDLKLIFVPLIFLLLRVWSAVIDIPIYMERGKREDFRETDANAALVFIAGIGDSAQGLANAVLFCVFTLQVRKKLLKVFGCNKIKCCHEVFYIPLTSSNMHSHETTTELDSNSIRSCSVSVSYSANQTTESNEAQVLLRSSDKVVSYSSSCDSI